MKKIIKLLVVANAILSVAVVGIMIWLIWFIKMDNKRHELPQAAVQDSSKNGSLESLVSKQIKIALSDDKILPTSFSAYADENIELQIANSGKTTRNLRIEKLNFDSGSIAPGETKKISLGKLPEKQESYEYKSIAAGLAEYRGILIVLVKN